MSCKVLDLCKIFNNLIQKFKCMPLNSTNVRSRSNTTKENVTNNLINV